MINLIPVKQKEEGILHNIMQFYIYEFTIYQDIKLEENGSFAPFDLTPYWKNPDFHAFFIEYEGELAGFALIETGTNGEPNIIREFFILRKFNRLGLGREASIKIFDMYPGKWSVTQVEKNKPAVAFWRKVIKEYTDGKYSEGFDDRNQPTQTFYSKLVMK
jgi:predicted acetyltransferase